MTVHQKLPKPDFQSDHPILLEIKNISLGAHVLLHLSIFWYTSICDAIFDEQTIVLTKYNHFH